jgi:hypothetical protein
MVELHTPKSAEPGRGARGDLIESRV